MCLRNLETSPHLIWECPVAMQAWNTAASWTGCSSLNQQVWSSAATTTDKVQMIVASAAPEHRKGTKTMIALISWHIWLEKNACIFRGKQADARHIIKACQSDMEQWRLAGARCIQQPFGDVT